MWCVEKGDSNDSSAEPGRELPVPRRPIAVRHGDDHYATVSNIYSHLPNLNTKMPITRNEEIEQLRAIVQEHKDQLSEREESPQSELDSLRLELTELRAQIVPAQGGDAFKLPDPFKYLSEFTGNKKELSAWLEEIDELCSDFKVATRNEGYSLSSLYVRAIKNRVKGEARTFFLF